MPNGIRYSGSVISGALNKNLISLAISGSYGPTATTGFFNGVDPTGSNGLGYVIYKTTTSNSSSIFVPQTNNELLSLARQEGATGANTGSNAAILSYFAATNFYLPTNFTYPTIYATGLTRNFDPAFVGSYPTTGSNWFSIGQGGSISLANNPTFFSGSGYGSGSFSFDGINDTTSPIGTSSTGVFTISMWLYTNLSTNATYSVIGGQSGTLGIAIIYSNGTQSISISNTGGASVPTINAGTDGNNGWVNYAMVRDSGGVITIYKNNVSLGTTFRSGTIQLLSLAKSPSSAYYSGLIGNILVYQSTQLTTAQLTENYNALRGRYGL
jgi:hypothetical protein